MKDQSGVSFKTVCETEHATLCAVCVPADSSERQYAMCSQKDPKMSAAIGESRVRGKEIRSSFLWWYLRLRHWKNQSLKDQLFWD